MRFKITPVDKKPLSNTGKKRGSSKYAPIIEAFLESGHKLVKVEGTGKDADSLRVQLLRLCKHRGLDSVTITVRNRELYLEKE